MITERTHALTTFLALLCLAGLLGCQSSGSHLTERREAHSAEYEALPVEERTSVAKGAVREGMHADAVLIAWGQPSIVSTNGEFVIWEYINLSDSSVSAGEDTRAPKEVTFARLYKTRLSCSLF